MNEKRIKALIVDDEEPARKLVAEFLSEMDEIRIIGECSNGFEAIKTIQEEEPDIIFLDIQMPKVTGFELLEVIGPGPQIIFTTAYDEYALKAFEMNAVDYLLKPFSGERFRQAVDKARERLGVRERLHNTGGLMKQVMEDKDGLERIVVRKGSKLVVIPVEKVVHIRAEGDYAMIVSELGSFLKESTMKYLEDKLPGDQFIRIHRSHIANIGHIDSVEPYSKDSHLAIMKNGDRIRISQEGYKKLRKMFE